MGCVIAGIILGGLTMILLITGFAFIGSESGQVVAGYIGVGFLLGAFVSGIGMWVVLNE